MSKLKKYRVHQGNRVFESVNIFSDSRKKEDLAILKSLYLDLDTKKNGLFLDDEEAITLIKDTCLNYNLPYPSRIVNSGNGFHIYWDIKGQISNLTGADKKTVKFYEAIEKQLVNIFPAADKAVIDVTRVLAKVGTPTKDGKDIVKIIFENDNFVNLSDFSHILKYSYEEVKEFKKITPKQIKLVKELQKEGLIIENIDINAYDKFTIKSTIRGAFGKKSVTEKQQNLIESRIPNTFNFKNMSVAEADAIIQENIFNSKRYLINMLNQIYKDNNVREGNRAFFIFFVTKGLLLANNKMTQTEIFDYINENYNLDLTSGEINRSIKSAFNGTHYIKKETVLSKLVLNDVYYLADVNGRKVLKKVSSLSEFDRKLMQAERENSRQITITAKRQVGRPKKNPNNGKKMPKKKRQILKSTIVKKMMFENHTSQRTLANELGVSVGMINKIIKEIKDSFQRVLNKKGNNSILDTLYINKVLRVLGIKKRDVILYGEKNIKYQNEEVYFRECIAKFMISLETMDISYLI